MTASTDLQEALQRCIAEMDAAEMYAVFWWAPWYADYEEVE